VWIKYSNRVSNTLCAKRDDQILTIIAIIGKNGTSERGMMLAGTRNIPLFKSVFSSFILHPQKSALIISNVNTLPFFYLDNYLVEELILFSNSFLLVTPISSFALILSSYFSNMKLVIVLILMLFLVLLLSFYCIFCLIRLVDSWVFLFLIEFSSQTFSGYDYPVLHLANFPFFITI
jgi:hypothetical protein